MEPLLSNSRPGTYALLLTVAEPLTLMVGQLGEMYLLPGCCIYVGSALGPGGLRARVAHHARIAARPHWHIDYLRRHAPLTELWYSHDPVRREHHWAALLQSLGGAVPLPGFGASDCRCPTHLFHFATSPAWSVFVQALQIRYPDHAPLERRRMAESSGAAAPMK
ncbi:MAG: GIY-YIG nuclease family protein [Candidatus Competibacteraceae bacterium]|nr:GIY-YIG nuclease family protein [Candidatus Competibacteraceae bacterium]